MVDDESRVRIYTLVTTFYRVHRFHARVRPTEIKFFAFCGNYYGLTRLLKSIK